MNYIEVEHPHGFLIWRGKQKAIANNQILPIDEQLLLVCNGEAYGKIKLAQPAAVNITEFDRLKDDHCLRTEERKMLWPDIDSLYVHRIENIEPFSGSIPVTIKDGQAEFISQPADLNKDESTLVKQAEKLPKTIILADDGLILDYDILELATTIDYTRALQAFEAAVDTKSINGRLPLYRLALVRQPHLIIERTPPKAAREQPDDDKKQIDEEGDNMPYTIEQDIGDCSGYAVVKETDREVMGCHETREEAEAQLIALNISEAEAESEKAEKTENNISVEIKDEMPEIEQPKTEKTIIEEDITSEDDDKAGRRIKKNWREKLQAAYETIKEMLIWADYEEDKILEGTTGFSIKQVNGQPYFTAWSTNAFEDREQEIFATKALEQYVAAAEENNERGTFNVWHIPNTDFAKKEWQAVIGRILVESGPFLDDERGQAALKFFTDYPNSHPELAPEGWGMSPEYRYLPEDRDDKVYDWLWITRSSVLAKSVAANIFTKGGLTMALTDEQKQAAEEIFGKGLAAQIITDAETESKKLEESGIAHKSDDSEVKTKPEPTEKAEKTEEPQSIDVGEIVTELVKQLDLSEMVKTVETVAGQVNELGQRLNQIEKGEKFKEQDEMPRYVLQLKRASEATETKVSEDDALREQKPKETKNEGGSLAGQFFTQAK